MARYPKVLAMEVGISPKYLSQIEADKALGVTAAVVKKIALALGVSADRLLGIPASKDEHGGT
jgi:transcriptional regulator with XRE-family HTH domain